jgi:nucleotidyltransferase substrate binding protein (TIGR01987 family)
MPSMGSETGKPRWHYRFDNFSRAVNLLREGIELIDTRALSQLEREGLIQRFEYSWELAWKTLNDYLDFEGIDIPSVTPRAVIRAAYAAGIIHDGDDWMAALDARNKMAHTYNFKVFEDIIAQIRTTYLGLLLALYHHLLAKIMEARDGQT